MAEIVGLAASLITLAGASAQLARTLLEVANVIKSAEYEARLIAADIDVFSYSLAQLSMVVDVPHCRTEQLREITVVLIAACRTLIEDLNMLIGEPVQRDTARLAFTMPILRFRLRWMKVGPKVMFVKSLIDSFKTTIIVLVSTMNLAVVLERNAPESISDSFKTQVESHIQFAEDATECLHHQKDIQQDQVSSSTLTLSSSASAVVEDATQRAGGGLVVLDPRPHEERGLTVRDRTFIGDERFDDDEYPLQVAGDYNQMIEMQQMSCALAKDVLESSSLKPAWSWNAPQESFILEHADFTASADDSSTFDDGPYEEISSRQQSEDLAQHDSAQERWKATEGSSTHRSARNATAKQSKYTAAKIIVPQASLPVGSDGEDVSRRDSQQGSHAAEETDVLGVFGQSFVASEGSSSRADTEIYPHVSPQHPDERLVHDDQPQGKMSHEPSSTSDSREGLHDDRSEAAHSFDTSTLSSPKPDHASDAGGIAPREGQSLPLDGATWTPLRSNVSLSHDVIPSPRSISRGSDTAWGQEEQLLKEEGLLYQQTVKRETREDDRLDRIERLLAAQISAKSEKVEARAAAERKAAEGAAEARKRGDPDKLAKLESLILAQKDEQRKREIAADAARAAEKAAADAEATKIHEQKMSAADKAKAVLEATARAREEAAIEIAQKTSAPITFHDPIGRKFPCPWHECSTREAMGEFIAKISAGVPVMLQLLSNGEYDLLKDDLVVPPHLWESTVIPGSSVTMRARNLVLPAIDKKTSWLRRSISRGSG